MCVWWMSRYVLYRLLVSVGFSFDVVNLPGHLRLDVLEYLKISDIKLGSLDNETRAE